MAEEPPRLVLLDLVLPGSDGIELMGQVREIADVPVIFLSVYGQDEVIARAFDEGAADYVVKPFSPTELAARIRADPAPAGGSGTGGARPALRARRADRGLRSAPGDAGREPGGVHRHRVPDAGGAVGQRRASPDPPAPAATGLGAGQGRGLRAGAEHRPEAAPQAGRRPGRSHLHLRLAHCRLPHGGGRGNRGGVGAVTAATSRPALGTWWLPQVVLEGVVQTQIESPLPCQQGLIP